MLKNIHLVLISAALFAGFNFILDLLVAVSATVLISVAWIAFNAFSIRYSLFVKSTCRIKTKEKIVFLSFDDGPSGLYTPLILKTLKQRDVSVLFFCIGRQAELFPALVQQISDAGHMIGNHTYSHKWQNAVKSPRDIESEIVRTGSILSGITGTKPTLFRPPFGITNPSIAKALKLQRMHSVGWDIRSFDTIIKDPRKLLHRITKRLRPGSIILLHDNREITATILDELIDTIQKQGYKIVPLPDLN